MVFHPAFEVIASIEGSGTSVTWSGFTERTRVINPSDGYPSMLNSVVIFGRSLQDIIISYMSLIGSWMYSDTIRSKKLTVYCGCQNIWDISTAVHFLIVAILLIFTLNFVIIINVGFLYFDIMTQNYNNCGFITILVENKSFYGR